MRAVIYCAKSTTDVNDSLPGQLADCRELAERDGLDVVSEYSEENESAYRGNRGPELRAAMDACERHAPCALVVQHTSRLARGNVRDSQHLVEVAIWAIRHEVSIVSVENPLPADNLLLLAAVAGDQDHAYSKRLGTSVAGGLMRSFERGNWPTTPSDGYLVRVERDSAGKTVRRWLEKDPEMEATIERILRLGLDQMIQPASIAGIVNREGRYKPGRLRSGVRDDGQAWRSRDVKRALCNPMYAGILRFRGAERRDACPRYISEEEHEDLVSRYSDVKPRKTGPRVKGGRLAAAYALHGLGVCGRCGQPLDCATITRQTPFKREYRCRSFEFPAYECRAVLDADRVDDEVVAWLDYLVGDFDRWRADVLESASGERAAAERELDRARSAVERLDAQAERAERDYLRAIEGEDDGGAAAATLAGVVRRSTCWTWTRSTRACAERSGGGRRGT